MKISRFATIFLSIAFIYGASGISAHAETYSGSINDVPAMKSTATFLFDFSENQYYEITLIDSNGDVYNKAEKGNQVEIDISNATGGDYTYTIDAENENYTHNVSVLEQGRVIASVDESNPLVTENVSDLQIFFADGDLVATWRYSGEVTISVMDPARFNYIESGYKTKENEYRKEIDDNVDSIQFYIVPSVDAKVSGAGLTYTRKVVREMNVTIEFPELPVVNTDVMTVPITVNEDNVKLKIYNNNFEVGVSNHNDDSIKTVFSDDVSKGGYEIDIPLISLDNNIVACFIDS